MANMNWIKDFSAPEPSTLLSRKALISFAIWKNQNLIKQKEPFGGEGAGIPSPPPPPNPTVQYSASALYSSAK